MLLRHAFDLLAESLREARSLSAGGRGLMAGLRCRLFSAQAGFSNPGREHPGDALLPQVRSLGIRTNPACRMGILT